MPQYYLSNGQPFWTEKELSPEELGEYLDELEVDTSVPEITPEVTGSTPASTPPVSTPPETTGLRDWLGSFIPEPVKDIWGKLNTGLIDVGLPEEIRAPFEEDHPLVGKGFNILTDIMSGLTSPLNVATGATLGGGAALAGRLPQIARGLTTTGKALSAPVAAEGAVGLVDPESSLIDRGVGALEAIGGIAGMRAKVPQVGKLAAEITPKVSTTAKEVNEILGTTKPMDVTSETMTQVPKGQPRNLINEGTDIVNTNTGEVIDTTIKTPEPKVEAIKPANPNKPSITPQTRKGINTGRIVLKNPTVETIQQLNADGYVTTGRKNKDGNPIFRRAKVTIQEPESLPRQIYNLGRGMMSIDAPFTTSAAFRQGLPWIGTRHWFSAYGKATKAFTSEQIHGMVEDKIKTLPIFKPRGVSTRTPGKLLPSPAEEMGIRLVDASDVTRGESRQLRINLAEKIPLYGRYVRASNRAYSTFLNDLRANAAQELWDNAIAQGLEPRTFSKQLGEFVNTSTGLGKLSFEAGTKNFNKTVDFEKNAQLLSDVFFSPRLMARNVRMLNPSTYAMAEPFVRKQYMHAMLRSMVAWGSMSSLAAMAGAEVNTDPSNADFGKIKIGNTRLDPAGGLQQYLVLAARIAQQKTTSSVSNETTNFGEGYKPPTTETTIQDFGANKLHPVLKFAYDMASAHPNRPMNVGDRLIQQVVPLYSQDIIEILNEHPELAPLIIAASSLGVGSQTYGEGKPEPAFLPEDMDLVIGRKR